MQSDTALFFFWLRILNRRRYETLREICGSLDIAKDLLSVELLRSIGMREETARDIFMRSEGFNAAGYREAMAKRGVELITIGDDLYPQALREVADPPIFLSYIGDISLLQTLMIGIVGTRRISGYGHQVVQSFVPPIVRAGVTTVSGLALGVDAEVARETITAHGKTIAVLGSGLGAISPSTNTRLANDIVRAGGLLLSEYPLNQMPEQYTFPARNRIIAGLSKATLVCEAPEGSGAVITAELAFDYGREVFVVPNSIFDPNYAGCHRLVTRGMAQIATSPMDVLKGMGMKAESSPSVSTFIPQTADEELVYKFLAPIPQSVDDLAEKSTLDASRIGVALTFMELAGAARNMGSGQWIRC